MDSSWQGTVLLADVRGDASRLYNEVGATKALQAIKQCITVIETTAWEGGATVVRTTGDEMMALFPAPAAAADAASLIQAAVDALPAIGTTKLGVRVAFHSGPVTVRNGDVLGATVTLASRLIEEAQKDQIITSRLTAAALGQAYKNRMRSMRQPQGFNPTSSLGMCEFVWKVAEQTTSFGASDMVPATNHTTLRLVYGITEILAKGERSPISLGRDFECRLVLLDERASRRHATIEQRGGEFVLIDHSTNGTYISEEGHEEVRVVHRDFVLHRHGWISFGRPREGAELVAEYFCA